MNALTELEQRADTEARHAHRELVERLDATLAEALECNEEFSMDNKYLKKRAEAAEAKLSKIEARKNAEITRLRTELEWYGEQARLCRLIHSEGDKGRHALSADGGNRARAALAELKRETGDE
jgi:regulator of replication initiation timing